MNLSIALSALMLMAMVMAHVSPVFAQSRQNRNRAETFYNLRAANTAGTGDLWLSLIGIGHIWDDAGVRTDKTADVKRRWVSNVRAFPEARIQYGVQEWLTLSVESRMLTWAWKPGHVSGYARVTPPNNRELRFHNYAMELGYRHCFTDGPPTLGGYEGFMPEGYQIEGGSAEGRMLYEMDLLPKMSVLPLRLIINTGLRVPVKQEFRYMYQYLIDAGVVYSGFGYDFHVSYSLESFDNLIEPKKVTLGTSPYVKRYLVYFSENVSYLSIGGNVRYPNGITLSLAIPLLLSYNEQSKMSVADLRSLNERDGKFPDEERRGIVDPFDPWFVKWKIVGSIQIPVFAKLTSTEMFRNLLLLKNRKEVKHIDIDGRLQSKEGSAPGPKEEADDARRRLEEIEKRKAAVGAVMPIKPDSAKARAVVPAQLK